MKPNTSLAIARDRSITYPPTNDVDDTTQGHAFDATERDRDDADNTTQGHAFDVTEWDNRVQDKAWCDLS
jgi:hypothetical protein